MSDNRRMKLPLVLPLMVSAVIACVALGSESSVADEKSVAGMIIISAINESKEVSIETLRRMYKGKKTHWDNGHRIMLSALKRDNRIQKEWLASILRLTDRQYKRIWLRNTFSGMADPPMSFSSEEEVIRYVGKYKGAIGYISQKDSLPANVKIITADWNTLLDEDAK